MIVERSAAVLQTGVAKLRGRVVHGFGRGSKLLGFPTANMETLWDGEDPAKNITLSDDQKHVLDFMRTVECGVYYGWAQVDWDSPGEEKKSETAAEAVGGAEQGTAEWQWAKPQQLTPAELCKQHGGVFKAWINIGWNPTFTDVKQKVLEAWILHDFGTPPNDFYGRQMRVAVCGFVRPEIKFDDFNELIQAIKDDGTWCEAKLDLDGAKELAQDATFFKLGEELGAGSGTGV